MELLFTVYTILVLVLQHMWERVCPLHLGSGEPILIKYPPLNVDTRARAATGKRKLPQNFVSVDKRTTRKEEGRKRMYLPSSSSR